MKLEKSLTSAEDSSVNFVFNTGAESRYVRRVDDYFICYLSTHNGCDKACRFCHLTQTGQTQMRESTIKEMVVQAQAVFAHYDSLNKPARHVNINFMARGEPLSSQVLKTQANKLFGKLSELAKARGLSIKFNISTIMPVDASFVDLYKLIDNQFDHQFYYSLYSLDPGFRRKWLPKAMPVKQALFKFKEWQQKTDRELALHWAFIAGENDSHAQMSSIALMVKDFNLKCKFNLVRYNPYTDKQGFEPDEANLQLLFEEFAGALGSEDSRIVPRVGYDVKASCGMFVA